MHDLRVFLTTLGSFAFLLTTLTLNLTACGPDRTRERVAPATGRDSGEKPADGSPNNPRVPTPPAPSSSPVVTKLPPSFPDPGSPPVTQSNPPPATPLPRLPGTPQSAAQIKACIESACGPANKNVGAYDVQLRPDSEITFQKLWKGEFEERIAGVVREKHKNEVLMGERVQRALEKSIALDSQHPFHAFIVFSQLTQTLSPAMKDLVEVDQSTRQVRLNESTLKRLIEPLSPDRKVATRALLERFWVPLYQSMANQPFDPLENRLLGRLKGKYPSLLPIEAQKVDGKWLSDECQRLITVFGEFLGRGICGPKLELFARAAKGEDLNKLESDHYVNDAESIETFGSIFDGAELQKVLSDVSIDYASEIQRFKDSGKSRAALEKLQKIDINEATKRISNNCSGRLKVTLALNASELRYRKVLDLIAAVRSAAKVVAARFVDPGSESTIASAIDSLQFSLPDTNAEKISRLKHVLERSEGEIAFSREMAVSDRPEIDQIALAVSISNNAYSTDSDDKLKKAPAYDDLEINRSCNALPIESISDFAITSLGKISVSWFSAAYPETGVAIIAHEVGHMVSTQIRRLQLQLNEQKGQAHKKFSNALTCVANRNPFAVKLFAPRTPIDNSQWSEEDWADHFSSLVLKELERTKSDWATPKNKGCALVLDNGDQYLDSSLDPMLFDTHSSGIMRLLFVGHDRGQLTKTCRPLLSFAEPAGRQLTCEIESVTPSP